MGSLSGLVAYLGAFRELDLVGGVHQVHGVVIVNLCLVNLLKRPKAKAAAAGGNEQ